MDTKIEELRKQTFGNVNRLDAKLDDLQAESTQAQQQLSTSLREEQGRLHASVVELRKSSSHMQGAAKLLADQLKACQRGLREL